MAQCFVIFSAVDNRRGLPAYSPYGAKATELTSSGSAAATTLTADEGDYARVVNNGTGTIWVTFGTAPVAAVGTTHPVGPGMTVDFGPLTGGHKASVIDDS